MVRVVDASTWTDRAGDEAAFLRRTWQRIAGRTVVSFHGRGFDLPVLEMRSLKLGVPAPRWFQGARAEGAEDHLDLIELLSNGRASPAAPLDLYAKLVGLPGKGRWPAATSTPSTRPGALDRIAAYCMTDVVQTWLLFLRYRLVEGTLTRDGYDESVASVRHDLPAIARRSLAAGRGGSPRRLDGPERALLRRPGAGAPGALNAPGAPGTDCLAGSLLGLALALLGKDAGALGGVRFTLLRFFTFRFDRFGRRCRHRSSLVGRQSIRRRRYVNPGRPSGDPVLLLQLLRQVLLGDEADAAPGEGLELELHARLRTISWISRCHCLACEPGVGEHLLGPGHVAVVHLDGHVRRAACTCSLSKEERPMKRASGTAMRIDS